MRRLIASHNLAKNQSCYTLPIELDNKANRAECANTPRGSNPTLVSAVTGLHRIIANRGTYVLRGFSGPTDLSVGLGRFVVPLGEV